MLCHMVKKRMQKDIFLFSGRETVECIQLDGFVLIFTLQKTFLEQTLKINDLKNKLTNENPDYNS